MPELAFGRCQPSSFLYRHRPCYRAPAIPDRRRRKCMSRRSGQNGRIERKGNALYARFWLDVPGQQSRAYKCVRICPVSGPGSLNKFEQKRRGKEIIAEFGANSEATLREAEAVNLGTTFQQQSERWLKSVQTRNGIQSSRELR